MVTIFGDLFVKNELKSDDSPRKLVEPPKHTSIITLDPIEIESSSDISSDNSADTGLELQYKEDGEDGLVAGLKGTTEDQEGYKNIPSSSGQKQINNALKQATPREFIVPKSTDSEGEEDGKATSSEFSKWRCLIDKNTDTNQSISGRKIGTWGERKQEVVEFSDADSPPAPMMEGNSNSTENYIKKTLREMNKTQSRVMETLEITAKTAKSKSRCGEC